MPHGVSGRVKEAALLYLTMSPHLFYAALAAALAGSARSAQTSMPASDPRVSW